MSDKYHDVRDEDVYRAKVGDTAYPIRETLSDDNGPIDLSGCTVIFRMTGPGQAFSASATIDNAPAGLVSYDWSAGVPDKPGLWLREWEITTGAGKKATIPSFREGYPCIISPQIG